MLGYTEYSLLLTPGDLPEVLLLDTSRLHADAIVQLGLSAAAGPAASPAR